MGSVQDVTSVASVAALTYCDNVLRRHGAEHRMLSGAVHYFRVHPDQWEDRLRRLAAMGANTVDTYIPWNFHEEIENQPRFDGWRDVEEFIRIAGTVGLDVYVRPSPYICAEWANGGLPVWLTGRTRGIRTLDPEYIRAVEAWYSVLLPRLTALQAVNGGPIVAVQIENEYGSFGSDREYIAHLRDLTRQHGIVELLTTADGTQADMQLNGSVTGAMPSFTFGTGVDAAQRLLPEKTPLLCSELWGGWFDHWGELHHTRSAESMIGTVDELLAAGGSVSLYMAHGGTNFGFWNGANWDGVLQPTATSYDSDAPISEDGRTNAKFDALRASFAPFHDGPLPELPPEPVFQAPKTLQLSREAKLLDVVRAASVIHESPQPATFEQLGVTDGLVAYEATIDVPGDEVLSVNRLHDRALVFVDGKRVGILERDGETRLTIAGPARRIELVIVVESLGRINYGAKTGEHKGILDGVLLGRRFVHGWRHRELPLDGTPVLGTPGADGTATARVDLDEAADAWISVPESAKGMVWVNGFLLGRYWERGPQKTLYAPAPLWRAGANEVRVLDLERLGATLEIRQHADFGESEEFIGT